MTFFRKSVVKYSGLLGLFLVLAISTGCAGGATQGEKGFKSSYDVVVIGSGGAGLSAAIAAKGEGADVIVFEKMGIPGGNTSRATGGINAAGTEYQKAAGIQDSPELFFADTMKGGYNKNDQALVRKLAEKSASSIEWLADMGADLSDVGSLAGASVRRAHRPSGGGKVGPEIITTLYKQVEQTLNIPVILGANVTRITATKGKVDGVELVFQNKTFKVKAKSVVLATGGFGANNEMATSFVPSLKGFATTNQPGATGDGILMAQQLGAALVDMVEIQTHPTHAPGKEMVTEAVRGNGAILVNKDGLRFVNEMLTRDVVSAAILAQKGGSSYLVFDDSVRKSLKAIEDYVKRDIVIEGATPRELAAKIGAGGAELAASIEKYNKAVAGKNDAEFGRPAGNMPRSLSTAPYYAIEVLPAIHHTMGGVKIDTSTRVIAMNGNPIPGFYAAGEITGGVHGGNRLGGNALADIIAYGRTAGVSASMAK